MGASARELKSSDSTQDLNCECSAANMLSRQHQSLMLKQGLLRMLRRIGVPLACVVALNACVSSPSNITASYVNHAQFRPMSCQEVQGDLQRVTAREADLSDRQHQNFIVDTALLTVGLVVFWPALLFMPATTDRRHEIAQMRGEKEALERAVTQQCATRLVATPPSTEDFGSQLVRTSAVALPATHSAAMAMRPDTWSFACPAANVTITASDGHVMVSDGADPADPLVCVSRIDGVKNRRLFGIFNTATAGTAVHRSGLARIFSPNGGAYAPSIYSVGEGSPAGSQYDESWRLIGFEAVRVIAGEYQVVLVERRRRGSNHDSTQRFWIDIATGVMVKHTIDLARGQSAAHNFEAARIDLPRT